jgi:hypothetical protein
MKKVPQKTKHKQRFDPSDFVAGEMPLSYCFWKVYVGRGVLHLVVIFVSFFVMLETNWVDPSPNSMSAIIFYGALVSLFIYFPFASVGTWRSATKHKENKGFTQFMKLFMLIVLYYLVDTVGGGF